MKTFKSIPDLEQVRNDPLYDTVTAHAEGGPSTTTQGREALTRLVKAVSAMVTVTWSS